MKILLLDIETAPHRVYAWGLFDQRIGINQIVEPGYTLCYSAKWLGDRGMMFDSVHQTDPDKMFRGVHKLLNEADAVCHYNGRKFDIPTLNGEFIRRNMPPPSPYKQIDLLTVCRGQARFASNKLDYVSQLLGLGQKTHHKGMPLWHACMEGDDAAWRIMERYNRQDVRLLERLHNYLRPWIKNYPNHGAFNGDHCCPVCSSKKIQSRGYYVTRHRKYPQGQCRQCFAWLYMVAGSLQEGVQRWRQAA
jgi:hypothetical protein